MKIPYRDTGSGICTALAWRGAKGGKVVIKARFCANFIFLPPCLGRSFESSGAPNRGRIDAAGKETQVGAATDDAHQTSSTTIHTTLERS